MAMTSVRMPDELAQRLEQLAAHLRRTKGWIINEALQQFIGSQERRQQMLTEAREGLESLEAGRMVGGDEVLDWLDSWGSEDELPPPKPR